jgi:cro protein
MYIFRFENISVFILIYIIPLIGAFVNIFKGGLGMENLEFEISVKTALLKRRLRNTDLANMIGVSESYLSDILKGNRKAEHHRKKICEVLDLDYGESEEI